MTGLFASTVLLAGFAILHLLGIGTGALRLGLAAASGLAGLAVLSSWGVLLHIPPLVSSALMYGLALLGAILAVRDRASIGASLRVRTREQGGSAAPLVAAMVIPFVAMGFAFVGAQVPLSPHDGASHAEAVQAFRTGQPWLAWYPPGVAALFATWLQVFPWIDSAQGAFELGLSLPALASLTLFGLAVSIWHDARIAATSALLLSCTYLYPYFPQLWSGWPLALSLILVMGMWTAALEYLARPSAGWSVLAGITLGAIVLVHGSELYTLAVVLPIVLLGALQRVSWRGLAWALCVAVLVSIASAAPYLPDLFRWAGGGGAYQAGLADLPVQPGGAPVELGQPGPFLAFALDAFGIDLPIRLVLVAAGVVWSIGSRAGRTVIVVAMVFASLAVALNVPMGLPLQREVYAVTFPWGMHYRLLMLVTIAQALLAGAGGVALLSRAIRRTRSPTAWGRRLGRLTRLLVVTWAGLTTVALAVFVAAPARQVLGFTTDDAAAMDWLSQHAGAADVVLNDGYADAGIWTPYKARLPILLPRTLLVTPDEVDRRTMLLENVARLDQLPAVRAVACSEGVRFVYSGSKSSAWDKRRFPPLEELRASSALEEAFRSGGAVIFRTHLGCE